MSQQKPERVSVEELLKLADQLLPADQERLVDEMKLKWLRRELAKGDESLDRGEGIPADQVFAELRERNKAFRENRTDF